MNHEIPVGARVFLRTPYNYDMNKAGDEDALHCVDKSLTRQSDSKDADINVIMKRYGVTGVVPSVALPPTYGDFSGVSDYREALDLIREADKSFMSLAADVRSRFNNDAGAFLAFVDSASREDLVAIGLIVEEPKAPDAVAAPKAP